ncbi:MAG: hypothetical protein ACJAWV_002969 [Flammeovirgaceae bacterium]
MGNVGYCKEQVDFVSTGLFLLKFGVPFWALAFVFGYNETWWYWVFISLGRHDIVGTTIYDAKDLPKQLIIHGVSNWLFLYSK